MENFWDSSIWGFINVMAVLLLSLLVANILRKSIKWLKDSLIPVSVIGGAILVLIAAVYKWATGDIMFDTVFFAFGSLFTEVTVDMDIDKTWGNVFSCRIDDLRYVCHCFCAVVINDTNDLLVEKKRHIFNDLVRQYNFTVYNSFHSKYFLSSHQKIGRIHFDKVIISYFRAFFNNFVNILQKNLIVTHAKKDKKNTKEKMVNAIINSSSK